MAIQTSLLGNAFLSRRVFILGAGSSAFAIACSSSGIGTDSKELMSEISYLRTGFADGLVMPSSLVVGSPQRAPFFLYASDGTLIVNNLPNGIAGNLAFPSGDSTPVRLEKYGKGIPTPYFLLNFMTSEVGLHKLSIEHEGEFQSLSFFVVDKSEVNLVQVGDPMRIAEVPTFENDLGFNPVCTRFDPCPFHNITLGDAVSNGSPTVLLISTPGFCQSSICGPSLELLLTAVSGKESTMNILHAEVYSDPEKITDTGNLQDLLAPVILEYGMDFEPSLVIADGNGVVVSRLDYTFDQVELENALSFIN